MNDIKIKNNLIDVYNSLSKIDETNYQKETNTIKKKIEKIIQSIDELEKESLQELTDRNNKRNDKNVVIYGEVDSDYETVGNNKHKSVYSWKNNGLLKFIISPLFVIILLGITIGLLIAILVK